MATVGRYLDAAAVKADLPVLPGLAARYPSPGGGGEGLGPAASNIPS